MKSLDNEQIVPYLHENYFKKLAHIDVEHPKIAVFFSGGNAVGKSTLARKIGDELQGLVIENDAMRELLLKYDPELVNERDKLGNAVWRYTQDLFPKLDTLTPNGLIVRDAVVDWSFEKILPLFEAAGYEPFIVRFELSREKRRELLRQRGGKEWISTESLEDLFATHEMHGERFLNAYTADIILDDATVFDHDSVIDALRQKMTSKIITN